MSDLTTQRIIDFIAADFGVQRAEIALHKNLVEAGILDSAGIFDLVGFLEDEFAIAVADEDTVVVLDFTPFCVIANQTGQPAMSVPLHWTEDNLPVGVQFFGRFGDEATLFRLAGQLEQASPWFNRRPPL